MSSTRAMPLRMGIVATALLLVLAPCAAHRAVAQDLASSARIGPVAYRTKPPPTILEENPASESAEDHEWGPPGRGHAARMHADRSTPPPPPARDAEETADPSIMSYEEAVALGYQEVPAGEHGGGTVRGRALTGSYGEYEYMKNQGYRLKLSYMNAQAYCPASKYAHQIHARRYFPPSPPPPLVARPPSPGCHPSASFVETCAHANASSSSSTGGRIRMDELRVGDRIRTPAGCEPVTAFLHQDPDAWSEYVILHTHGERELSISPRHFVWANDDEVDPATVGAGDVLEASDGRGDVVSHRAIERRAGSFHPMVPSGFYYVDGVRASTYIALYPKWTFRLCERYVEWRYRIHVPIVPEGQGRISLRWVERAAGAVAHEDAIRDWLWPVTMSGIAATELANAAHNASLGGVASSLAGLAIAVAGHVLLHRSRRAKATASDGLP